MTIYRIMNTYIVLVVQLEKKQTKCTNCYERLQLQMYFIYTEQISIIGCSHFVWKVQEVTE